MSKSGRALISRTKDGAYRRRKPAENQISVSLGSVHTMMECTHHASKTNQRPRPRPRPHVGRPHRGPQLKFRPAARSRARNRVAVHVMNPIPSNSALHLECQKRQLPRASLGKVFRPANETDAVACLWRAVVPVWQGKDRRLQIPTASAAEKSPRPPSIVDYRKLVCRYIRRQSTSPVDNGHGQSA